MIAFTFSTAGKNTFFRPVMTKRPAASLAAARRSTSPRLAAEGFSIQTCAPAANALSAIGKALGPQFGDLLGAVEGLAIPELHAEVKTATLAWNREDVPCFKIEYRKPDDPQPANARAAKQASAAAAHLVRELPNLAITVVPSNTIRALMPLCHYDDGSGAPVA